MNNLNYKPLREFCSEGRGISYGIVQPGQNLNAGVPIVRVNNFSNGVLNISDAMKVSPEIEAKFARTRVQTGDVLITLVGSIGQVAVAPEEISGWNLARAVGLVPMPDAETARWVAFALSAPFSQNYIRERANTTVQATFNLKDLAELPIPNPSNAAKKSILEILKPLDDKIEINRKMNETLEGMARAVFRDWFVDFGPTRRKMAGEVDPVKILGGAITASPQAQKTAALFPDTLGENGLPEGWEEKPFSVLVEIIGGGTPKTKIKEYWGGDIPWFSVVDTPSGSDTFVFGTQKQITQAGLKNSSAKLIEVGTTIISARGTVGNLAIAGENMTFNQSCYALKGENRIGQAFTYLGAQRLVLDLQRMAHGAVFSTITRSTFSGVEFAFPPEGLCNDFEKFMRPLFEKIKTNVEENQTLAEMRDLLLPKLMSGEIRLKNRKDVE